MILPTSGHPGLIGDEPATVGAEVAKRAPLRYGYILGVVLVVFSARLALDPILGDRSPLILFTIAVAVAAAGYGTGGGILALVFGSALGVWFFVEPRGSMAVFSVDEAVNLVAFYTANAAVLVVTHRLRSATSRQASVAGELRQREGELRQSRDLLQAVIDGTPDVIYVKDRNGSFVLINKGTARLLGKTAVEIVRRRDADFLPQHVAVAIESVDQAVMQDGQALVREEAVPQDGVNRVFLSSKAPWLDGDGKVIGLIGISRDITERKAAEAQLATSEAQLRAFFDASAAGLLQIDPSTRRFVQVNGAVSALTGYDAEELLELTPEDLTDPDDRAAFGWLLDGLVHRTQSVQFAERMFRRKDGSSICVVVGASLIRDAEGEPFRIAAVAIDVTDRKSAEAEVRRLNAELERRVEDRTRELAEANDELNAFTYTVSHDLRAPLRAMEGFARILLEDYASSLDEDGQRYAGRIVAAAERMEGLIDDLLAYSRITRSELRVRPVELASLVCDVIPEDVDPRYIDFRLKGVPAVLGEPGVLRQLMTNLLSNAAKFQLPGKTPEITVDAVSMDGQVRITVSDNGIGISPEHAERIFRVFERLHGQEAYPGTGIGLAIVRKGVERMGGTSGVESTLGVGSRFWIELPAAPTRDTENVHG